MVEIYNVFTNGIFQIALFSMLSISGALGFIFYTILNKRAIFENTQIDQLIRLIYFPVFSLSTLIALIVSIYDYSTYSHAIKNKESIEIIGIVDSLIADYKHNYDFNSFRVDSTILSFPNIMCHSTKYERKIVNGGVIDLGSEVIVQHYKGIVLKMWVKSSEVH